MICEYYMGGRKDIFLDYKKLNITIAILLQGSIYFLSIKCTS